MSPSLQENPSELDAAVEDHIARSREKWIGWFRRLISAGGEFENEHEVVKVAAALLAEAGCSNVSHVSHDRSDSHSIPGLQPPLSSVPDRCSLAATVGTEDPTIILNTHLDIAPVGDPSRWSRPPLDGLIEKDRIWGRGSMDDKAGAATALAVADILCHSGVQFEGRVVFHFALEDEITGNGSLLLLEQGHTGDAAVIIDGTRPNVVLTEHAGQLEFECTIPGRPVSVCVSHMGAGAAELLAEFTRELRNVLDDWNEVRTGAWKEYPSPNQISLQSVECDSSRFTLPEEAMARFFCTFCAPRTLSEVRDTFQEIAKSFVKEHALPGPIHFEWNGMACEPCCGDGHDGRWASSLADRASRSGFGEVRVMPSSGTSDLRHFAARKIPCALYGPGRGYNPHQPDEYYLLEDFVPMIRYFTALAVDFSKISHAQET